MAVYLTNSFEGGTNASTVTTGNSGGNSGNAFDVVNIGASATIIFSSTEAAHGTLSGKYTQPSSAVIIYTGWTTSLTASSIPTVYYRAYVYLPTLPPVTLRFIQPYDGSSVCAGIAVSSSGKVVVEAGTGDLPQYTSTNSVNTAGWFRVEGAVTGSSTAGQVSMSLYNTPDSVTATESFTSASTVNTTGAINGIRFGSVNQGTSYTWYMDDLGASDTGLLGPSQYTGTGTGAIALIATSTGSKPAGAAAVHNNPIIAVLTAADLI